MRIGVGPLVAFACLTAVASGQAPAITSVQPQSLQPGSTELTVSGTNLSPATEIWTNAPGKLEVSEQGEKANSPLKLKCELPAETPLQVVGLRVATENGGSNLHLLLIDDLPSVASTGKNTTPTTAQVVETPTSVDGAATSRASQYFALEAKAGQKVSFEIWARRLGSSLDPVMRLLDETGSEIAYSDDEPGIPADCRFRVTIPHDGRFVLEVRDINYAGSALHRYHLRIGDFPLVNTPFPLAVEGGKSAHLWLAGPGAEDQAPLDVKVPQTAESIHIGKPSPAGGLVATVAVTNQTEFVEHEPNDSAGGESDGKSSANQITIPCGINGRFQLAGDRDRYTFAAKKGEKFSFVGQTRSLGSPVDLLLSVTDEAGKQLGQAEDAGTDEGVLAFTAPADGNFVLLAEDLLRRGGPEFAYRVAATEGANSFALIAEVDKYDVPQQGVMVVKLKVTRRGYTGPIALHLEGAPEGTTVTGEVADKKADGVAKIHLPDSIKPGTMFTARLIGTAEVAEGQSFSAIAETRDVLRTVLKGLTWPPNNLNGVLAVTATPPFPSFFELACETKELTVPRLAGTTGVKITTKRLNKFADAVTLAAEKPPAGLTIKPTPIAKGKNDVTLEIAATDKLPLGEYSLQLNGQATFSDQPQSVTLPPILIKVVDALELSAELGKPLAAGTKQSLRLSIVRNAKLPGPVEVAFADVPAGVKFPEKVSIPADKNELEVLVEVAADAKLDENAPLKVSATTKFEKQTISAQAEVPLVAKQDK